MTELPPKKITLRLPGLNLSGAERVALNLAAAFKELRVTTWHYPNSVDKCCPTSACVRQIGVLYKFYPLVWLWH